MKRKKIKKKTTKKKECIGCHKTLRVEKENEKRTRIYVIST